MGQYRQKSACKRTEGDRKGETEAQVIAKCTMGGFNNARCRHNAMAVTSESIYPRHLWVV